MIKIVSGDITQIDTDIIIYLSNDIIAKTLKKKHNSLYHWIQNESNNTKELDVLITSTPLKKYIILYAADIHGGIKASRLYKCMKEAVEYLKDENLIDKEISISSDLYNLIMNKDYIKE